jgi:hypothetical protein
VEDLGLIGCIAIGMDKGGVSSRRRGSSTPEFRDRRRKKRQQGDLV